MHATLSGQGGHGGHGGFGGGGGGGRGGRSGRGGCGGHGGNRKKKNRGKKKSANSVQRRVGPPFMEPRVDVSRWPFHFVPYPWEATEQMVLQLGCPHCGYLPCLVFTYGILACQYAIELVETEQTTPFSCRFIAAARFVYLVCLETEFDNPFQTHLVQFHDFAPIVTMDLLPACMVAHLNEEFGNDSEPFMATVTTPNNGTNEENNENDENHEHDENDIAV